jgi:hypothetical protein
VEVYVTFSAQPRAQVAETRMSPLLDMRPKKWNGLEGAPISRTALTAVATVAWSLVNWW